ncbi:MAG: hypothetical protein H6732_01875 [Alphaproteobacteria bacterium]|nr:hypothetical protein [Alphaproteobacteria bacterium]
MTDLQHERLGWWWICVFAALGLVLETLHGLKLPVYLDPAAGPRRLLWTLAHAHGVLLGLVHLGFAATLRARPAWEGRGRILASRLLVAAAVLLPAGFFLGGLVIHGGDPNALVLLTPVGGLALVGAAALTARATP